RRKCRLLVRELSFVFREAHPSFARRVVGIDRQKDGTHAEELDARLTPTSRPTKRFEEARGERRPEDRPLLTQGIRKRDYAAGSADSPQVLFRNERVEQRLTQPQGNGG